MIKVVTFTLLTNSIVCLLGLVLLIIQANPGTSLDWLPVKSRALLFFLIPFGGNVLAALVLMILRWKLIRPESLRFQNLTLESRSRAWQRLKRLTQAVKYTFLGVVAAGVLSDVFGLSRKLSLGRPNLLGTCIAWGFAMVLFLSPWILLYGHVYGVDGTFMRDDD